MMYRPTKQVKVTIGDRPKDRRNLILAMRARRLIPQGELLEMLTDREAETMMLKARGLSNHEIAGIMGITVHTVRNHVSHSYQRLGLDSDREDRVPNMTTFIRFLTTIGWLRVPDSFGNVDPWVGAD